MIRRANPFITLAFFLVAGFLRAEDTPKLIGSAFTAKEAASKSDAIFVGEITKTGTQTELPTTIMYAGIAYKGFKVKVSQVISGSVGPWTSVTLIVGLDGPEIMPKVGASYIFFVSRPSDTDDPFYCFKLMIATEDNVAKVEKLVPK